MTDKRLPRQHQPRHTRYRYVDPRARRLAGNGHLAALAAAPFAAFLAMAVLGSGARLHPVHGYLAAVVLTLAGGAVVCLALATRLESRARRAVIERQAARMVAERLAVRLGHPVGRQRIEGATAAEVAQVAPRPALAPAPREPEPAPIEPEAAPA